MWFRSLLNSLNPGRSRPRAGDLAGRLQVEALEDRSVPAVI